MTLESILFILLVFLTFYNNGVQGYIHFEAYPLIGLVGKSELSAYLKEYEGRITPALLLPYGLTLLSNLALIFIRPAALSVVAVILALLLNLSVAVVTQMVATPVYNQVKQNQGGTAEEMARLLRINLLRLGLSTVSSLVVAYMLITLLTV